MQRDQPVGVQRRAHHVIVAGRRLDQDAALGVEVGIVHVDLQQEAIQLGFGQGVGAFLLDRVLRRQNMEGRGQVMAHTGHGDMALLHRLEQGRLGARAGAVDLVRHQQLGEDRPFEEAEGALPARAFVQHFRADNV